MRRLAVAIAAVGATSACSATPGGGSGGGGGGDTIKLGVNYELSGGVATYGQASVAGIKMAIDAINEAVYAAIPKKLGDREYWAEWAKGIGQVAERLIARINALVDSSPALAQDFARFLKGLQDTLNPTVGREYDFPFHKAEKVKKLLVIGAGNFEALRARRRRG